jgi:23S rRNA (cytosine1962-C5)-methyltransferase
LSADPSRLAELITKALRHRPTLTTNPKVECWRVFGGRADGLDGLFIDRYGPGAVMITYESTPAERYSQPGARQDAAKAVLEALKPIGVEAVYAKPFVRDRSRLGGDGPDVLTTPTPAAGTELPEHLDLSENGLRIRVRLYDGFSTGIFLDQRANRSWVRDWCRDFVRAKGHGPKVLNTFAYTCAFGAAAASADESVETTNIDVSPRYLDWGKENYTINAIDPERHYFTRFDTRSFLALAQRKNIRFDLIILDPPTFGSADKRRGVAAWKADRDYPALVAESIGALAPGGTVLASTNCTQLCEPNRFRSAIVEGAGHRQIKWLDLPPMPEDFAREEGRFIASAFSVAGR